MQIFIDAVPETIEKAGNLFSLFALIVLAISVLCYIFYQKEKGPSKNRAFLFTLLFFSGLVIVAFLTGISSGFQEARETPVPSSVTLAESTIDMLERHILSQEERVTEENKTETVTEAIEQYLNPQKSPDPPKEEPDPPPTPNPENQVSILRLGDNCQQTSGPLIRELNKKVAVTRSMVSPLFASSVIAYTCSIPQNISPPYEYFLLRFGVPDTARDDLRYLVKVYTDSDPNPKGEQEIAKGQGLKAIEISIEDANNVSFEVHCDLGPCNYVSNDLLQFTEAHLSTTTSS